MQHIFHVHTVRCKHASDECDEDYIAAALELGAEKSALLTTVRSLGIPSRTGWIWRICRAMWKA